MNPQLKEKILKINGVVDVAVFFKWLLLASLSGGVIGGVGVLFHFGLSAAGTLRGQYSWLLFLLPAGGLAIVGLYRVLGMTNDRGTDFVLVAVRSNEKMSLKTAPLIFVSTLLTHLFGGSAGREGAALQMGGSIGATLGGWLRLDEKDARIMVMCGMSAAFSALFGTPLTSAIFSMEVISVGVMYYSAIVPCIVSAILGYGIAAACGVEPTRFFIAEIPPVTFLSLLQAIGLAILFAILSILFCVLMQKVTMAYKRYLPNKFLCIAVGGALVVALSCVFATRDYNGAGMDVIARAIAGEARPEAFLLKMVFTALTLGAGFKGGEIVPSFFTGATFGCTMAKLMRFSPSLGAGLGLVSVFCGVTNCPMTSIVLSIELFGSHGLIYFALSCAVSYMLSGYFGLYSEQKILYSKLKPEFIDKKVE